MNTTTSTAPNNPTFFGRKMTDAETTIWRWGLGLGFALGAVLGVSMVWLASKVQHLF